ncbi:MAG: histidine kinase [Bacteroidota bacterium]
MKLKELKITLTSLVFFLFFCLPGKTQAPVFKNYSIPEGLPSAMVYYAFEDSRNFMWFGTDKGVSRFNGTTFENFTTKDGLSDNEVFKIFEDSSARIWFLTFNGRLSYYKGGKFYDRRNDPVLSKVDPGSYAHFMFEDSKGRIWVATDRSGIVMIDGEHVEQWINKDGVNLTHPLYVFEYEQEVYGLCRNSVFSLTGKSEELIRLKAGATHQHAVAMPTDTSLFYVHPLVPDKGMEIWDFSLNGFEHKVESHPEFDIKWSFVNVNIDFEKNIWIGTNNGAYLLDENRKSIKQTLLKGKPVTSVARDFEGNYWFTTLNQGIFFASNIGQLSYHHDSPSGEAKVFSVYPDTDGSVYFGKQKGMFKITDGGATSVSIDGLQFDRVTCILNSNGRLFFGADQGFFVYEDGILTQLNGYQAKFFSELDQSRLISGTGRVCFLVTLPEKGDSSYDYRMDTVYASRSFCALPLNDTTAWIGTNSGVKQLAISGDNYNLKDVLPDVNIRINGLALTKQGIWLSSDVEGLFLYQNQDIVPVRLEGLNHVIIHKILADPVSGLWIGSNLGLFKLEGRPGNYKLRSFSAIDGIASDQINDMSFSGDTLWLATGKGVTAFFEKQVKENNVPPKIYLRKIAVDNMEVTPEKNQRFSHKENDIRIELSGISYHSNGDLQFRYRLNTDEEWSFTQNRILELNSLTPDRYSIEVQAINPGGIVSENTINFEFKIDKPVWRQAWFIILCVLTGLFLALAVYAYQHYNFEKRTQLTKQLSESRQKALRAQIRPHFIANALNSIQELFLTGNVERANEYLADFGELVRATLHNSQSALVTFAEEFKLLELYLKLESLRVDRKFRYAIKIDPEIDIFHTKVPSLLFQPFLENAIWHGILPNDADGMINIDIKKEGGFINGVVEDNGIGRAHSAVLKKNFPKKHNSMGIKITKERLRLLTEKIETSELLKIEDLKDENGDSSGTRVTLKIPIGI